MIVIVLFIIFVVSLALFPSTNEVITGIDTTGWGVIPQAEHVILPFLFLFAVVICAVIISRRKGGGG